MKWLQVCSFAPLFATISTLVGCIGPDTDSGAPEQAPPDLEAANAVVADLTPYIQWDSQTGTILFDDVGAQVARLPDDRIQLGVELVQLTQQLSETFDPNTSETPDVPSVHLMDVGVDLTYPWITPLTAAAFQAFFVALGDVCPSPRFQPPNTSWATQQIAIGRLLSAGYRYTKQPTGACAVRGPKAYGQTGTDFTKPLYYSVYGSAATPCYRYQGVVSQSPPWTYQVQGAPPNGTIGTREPNPEICEYAWPTWWWGAYTAYFHMVRC